MPPHLPIKKSQGGQALLNLACGIYMHHDWNNVDFNPYTWMVRHPSLAATLKKAGILSNKRYERLKRTDPQIIRWDLRRGIPFADASFDVVYHSHFLEHLPKSRALLFLRECHRVLKSGGLLRVVIPDLRYWAERFLESFAKMQQATTPLECHEMSIDNLIGQMVHAEHSSTREQRPAIRFIEGLIRGGTHQTGELHRWMYDIFTLSRILQKTGFVDLQAQTATSSRLPGFTAFCLDTDEDGSVRKPESLYMEAEKRS